MLPTVRIVLSLESAQLGLLGGGFLCSGLRHRGRGSVFVVVVGVITQYCSVHSDINIEAQRKASGGSALIVLVFIVIVVIGMTGGFSLDSVLPLVLVLVVVASSIYVLVFSGSQPGGSWKSWKK
jgi:uncharacterized membrane protein YhaH (DUF805 family)